MTRSQCYKMIGNWLYDNVFLSGWRIQKRLTWTPPCRLLIYSLRTWSSVGSSSIYVELTWSTGSCKSSLLCPPPFSSMLLGFELRALHFMQTLYHLTHTSSPFCFIFSDKVSFFCLGPALDCHPPTYSFPHSRNEKRVLPCLMLAKIGSH
jgi:hypothetical protein